MKQIIKYGLLLFIPFAIVIIVNEAYRPFIAEKSWKYLGVSTMNSADYDLDKCTWACHNSTSGHCVKHHTKLIKPGFPFYEQINAFYEGIISFNPHYALENLLRLKTASKSDAMLHFLISP